MKAEDLPVFNEALNLGPKVLRDNTATHPDFRKSDSTTGKVDASLSDDALTKLVKAREIVEKSTERGPAFIVDSMSDRSLIDELIENEATRGGVLLVGDTHKSWPNIQQLSKQMHIDVHALPHPEEVFATFDNHTPVVLNATFDSVDIAKRIRGRTNLVCIEDQMSYLSLDPQSASERLYLKEAAAALAMTSHDDEHARYWPIKNTYGNIQANADVDIGESRIPNAMQVSKKEIAKRRAAAKAAKKSRKANRRK